MQQDEVARLFEIYDGKRQGVINYSQFLVDLVTKMSEKRHQLTIEAFRHIDNDRSGFLDLEELKCCFCARRHPDVLSRVKTPDEA
jgi:Ca2+-binding EF-hand superfamily protein